MESHLGSNSDLTSRPDEINDDSLTVPKLDTIVQIKEKTKTNNSEASISEGADKTIANIESLRGFQNKKSAGARKTKTSRCEASLPVAAGRWILISCSKL